MASNLNGVTLDNGTISAPTLTTNGSSSIDVNTPVWDATGVTAFIGFPVGVPADNFIAMVTFTAPEDPSDGFVLNQCLFSPAAAKSENVWYEVGTANPVWSNLGAVPLQMTVNTGGFGFTPTNGRLLLPQTGLYHIHTTACMRNGGGASRLFLFGLGINGSPPLVVSTAGSQIGGMDWMTVTGAGLATLPAGAEISMWIKQIALGGGSSMNDSRLSLIRSIVTFLG